MHPHSIRARCCTLLHIIVAFKDRKLMENVVYLEYEYLYLPPIYSVCLRTDQ